MSNSGGPGISPGRTIAFQVTGFKFQVVEIPVGGVDCNGGSTLTGLRSKAVSFLQRVSAKELLGSHPLLAGRLEFEDIDKEVTTGDLHASNSRRIRVGAAGGQFSRLKRPWRNG